jgi:hypothetical protein
MLQEANTRIETLEANLVAANRRLDAQNQQINSMGEIMATTTTTSLLMSDYMPSSTESPLLFGDQ